MAMASSAEGASNLEPKRSSGDDRGSNNGNKNNTAAASGSNGPAAPHPTTSSDTTTNSVGTTRPMDPSEGDDRADQNESSAMPPPDDRLRAGATATPAASNPTSPSPPAVDGVTLPAPPPPHQDTLLQYLARSALHDDIGHLLEKEFHQRSQLVSESHRIYSNIAHRFVSLLEADTKRWTDRRRYLEMSVVSGLSPERLRDASSTSPRFDFFDDAERHADSHHHDDDGTDHRRPSPPPHNNFERSLFLSANKLDHTDPRLAPSHSLSPRHRRHRSGAARDGDEAAAVDEDEQQRMTSIAHVEMSGDYQARRKQYAVRRLEQQLEDQAKVVTEFQFREARRTEAFRRREAMLLKKALENEVRNATSATERGRLNVQHFDATRPLRLRVEEKGESSRIAMKATLLKEQAKARAGRMMDLEAQTYINDKQRLFEQRMAALQDVALATQHEREAECTNSKSTLSKVLIQRTIRQGQYQRVFHSRMQATLDAKKRQDYEGICSVLRSKYAEPIGAEVRWSLENLSDEDEGEEAMASGRTAATTTPSRGGGRGAATPRAAAMEAVPVKLTGGRAASSSAAAARGGGTSAPSRRVNATLYARLCGAKESAVRGLVHAGQPWTQELSAAASASLMSASPVVKGAIHVGWR